jgi:hypothetical protein
VSLVAVRARVVFSCMYLHLRFASFLPLPLLLACHFPSFAYEECKKVNLSKIFRGSTSDEIAAIEG